MNKYFLIYAAALSCISFQSIGQVEHLETFHPTFSTFEGDVFRMPVIKRKKGKLTTASIQGHYGENVYDYNKIGSISLDKINIQETNTGSGFFPGVEPVTRFAMVLYNQMKIEKNGCYQFKLNSDDGSVLWLNEEMILNNDGEHGMRLKIDSIIVAEGEYDVKLWYFQGMPDRFGFIFDAKYLGDESICTKSEKGMIPEKKDKIVLSHLNFNHAESHLNERGLDELHQIVKIINENNPTSIKVVGHTDNVGSHKNNEKLSIARASFVIAELRKRIDIKSVELIHEGKGETEPVESNPTKKGKAANRRVEIYLLYN